MGQFYHIFANGDDAKDFITSKEDFKAAFNRFGVCAAMFPGVKVQAFSIEESHPHGLIYGEYEDCVRFKRMYESMTLHYIVSSRGDMDGVVFELEMCCVKTENYLLNVASYVIVQPTKDGKQVMPYDYYWGTGSMYFRPAGSPLIWCFDSEWNKTVPVQFGTLSYRQKHAITHSKKMIPDSWLVCNGLILPSNYIDVGMYESIFKSFNRFRAYMSAGQKQLQLVSDTMASVRGVSLPDLEARKLAQGISQSLFGKRDSRWLNARQRYTLAKELRNKHHLSFRQISTLARLPESELRKYLR